MLWGEADFRRTESRGGGLEDRGRRDLYTVCCGDAGAAGISRVEEGRISQVEEGRVQRGIHNLVNKFFVVDHPVGVNLAH